VRLALGQLAEAEKAASQALATDGKQADWHALMARVYAAEKRSDDALSEAKAALALVGNLAPAKLVEADVLAEKGELDLALETYQTAFGYSRTDPTALVHAASACLASGRDTSAKGFADRATQLFPKWGPGWVVLGDVLVRWKDKPGARQAYQTALSAEGPVDAALVQKKLAALK
jgi:tetratricopeptide (TPR) repeat protein